MHFPGPVEAIDLCLASTPCQYARSVGYILHDRSYGLLGNGRRAVGVAKLGDRLPHLKIETWATRLSQVLKGEVPWAPIFRVGMHFPGTWATRQSARKDGGLLLLTCILT